MTSKPEAWRACQTHLALRLSGLSPTKPTRVEFNVQDVIDAIYWDYNERQQAIKRGFEATRKFDDALFRTLRNEFETAWNKVA